MKTMLWSTFIQGKSSHNQQIDILSILFFLFGLLYLLLVELPSNSWFLKDIDSPKQKRTTL